MMRKLRLEFPVSLMCRVFDVTVSGYYTWITRQPSQREKDDARLAIEIRAAHKQTRETYGPERLQQDLTAKGIKISVHRVKRIRKDLGLRCKQKQKFKVTTDSRHALPVAENLLRQKFAATTAPNQVWVTDITYIRTDEGWLYLAGHKDLFTGEIVGYSMSERMTKNLVNQSLFRAVASKRPPKGLVMHSDRGSQYCSHEHRKLMAQFGMQASMSGKGNCFDNAPMESFWGILKTELVHHRRYATRQEAKRDISEYIEIFYNRQRRQARLNYLSPAAYARSYYEKAAAA